ncbi:SDR family oxidoreductase [Streptomyces enissocaesilis]|uniref:SDR family oxidoreductase n=1 Tax=Streptomyces enissocaesilis TaxID=332589 RepID=A0ABP6K5Z2_9ACTN
MLHLLTGGTGFLGSHLLASLLDRGESVAVLYRGEHDRARERLEHALRATDLGSVLPAPIPGVLRMVPGDVTRPQLGMDRETYRELGQEVTVVWHSAGCIQMASAPELLHTVNVQGTEHVLQFAAAAAHRPRVLHVSTAYVAGGLLEGTVTEDHLSDRHGFLNRYEESKYQGEQAIHRFAQEHGLPATIVRPSVLVTDSLRPAEAPAHPFASAQQRLSRLARRDPTRLIPGTLPGGRVHALLPGHPDATMNIVQVEYAADAIVHLARQPATQLVDTFHVTHPTSTPLRRVLDAMEEICPWLQMFIVPEDHQETAGTIEQILTQIAMGAMPHARLCRSYARTRTDAAVNTFLAPPTVLDTGYLRASLGLGTALPAPA